MPIRIIIIDDQADGTQKRLPFFLREAHHKFSSRYNKKISHRLKVRGRFERLKCTVDERKQRIRILRSDVACEPND